MIFVESIFRSNDLFEHDPRIVSVACFSENRFPLFGIML
jgi:hypothetical protein